MSTFTISGQIKNKRNDSGIPALTVEVVPFRGKVVYGKTLTAKDGSYVIRIDERDHPSLFKVGLKAGKSVFFQFRDRDDQIVGRLKKGRELKPGTKITQNASLGPDALKNHLSRPLLFKDLGNRRTLRPMPQINRSLEALTRIGPSGGLTDEYFNDLLPCIEPPIGGFGTIVDDAIGVLDGDPIAVSRFRDTLNELIQTTSNAETYQIIRKAVMARGNPYAGVNRVGRDLARARPSVVDADAGRLLLVAAIDAANGNQGLAEDYVSVLAHQFGAYQRLAPLYEAGERALSGGRADAVYLLDMLGAFERFCDPIIPNPDDVDEWEPGVLECSYDGLDDLVTPGITYVIEDVQPPLACAGEQITISGANFGPATNLSYYVNRVRFMAASSDDSPNYIDVFPDSWDDTQITVTIPDGAEPGPLSLRIRENVVPVCGHYHEIFRRGESFDFQGGSAPVIYFFQANGEVEQLIVAPGEDVTLAWSVDDSATTIRIEPNLITGGLPGAVMTGLDPEGEIVAPIAGNPILTAIVDFTLIAEGGCGERERTVRVVIHRQAQVFLTDMEVTQATQFLRAGEHMTLGTSVRPDNSVALIQNKATLVRVYFATDQDPTFNNGGSAPGVAVRLRGFRDGSALEGSPLTPLSEPLTASPDTTVASQRGTISRSANFLLPNSWTLQEGNITLEADLSLTEGSFDIVDDNRQRFFLEGLQFFAANPLDCVLVRVSYTGPQPPTGGGVNGTLNTPPTVAAAAATINAVRRMYPTDSIQLFVPPNTADQVISQSQPLTLNNSFGVSGWDMVITQLMGLAAGRSDDDNMVWCGVAHAGVPIFFNPGATAFIGGVGCGNCLFARGYATFRAISDSTPEHEIGHALDRPHHNSDPDWAAEGPGRTAAGLTDSIGEFGVNVEAIVGGGTGNIISPASVNDIMQSVNSGARWISPYTYKKLMQDFLAPQAPGNAAPTFSGTAETINITKPQRSEHLVIQGTLFPHKEKVELKPLYHLKRRPERRMFPLQKNEYAIVVVDKENRTLSSVPISDVRDRPIRSEDEFGKPVYQQISFLVNVPLVKGAVAVEVVKGRKTLVRVEKPSRRPHLSKPVLSKMNKQWTLSWEAKHPDAVPLTYMVWITLNGGKRWQRIDQGLRRSKFSLEPGQLPGGKKCRLRVYACDGFNTVYKETSLFSLPLKPPEVVPINFEDGDEIPANRLVLLEAATIWALDGSRPSGKMEWESDKQGKLGTGEQIWVQLEPGRHRLTISVERSKNCVGQCVVSLIAGSRNKL